MGIDLGCGRRAFKNVQRTVASGCHAMTEMIGVRLFPVSIQLMRLLDCAAYCGGYTEGIPRLGESKYFAKKKQPTRKYRRR